MKFGIRRSRLKKPLKALTTGKWKHPVKKQTDYFYEKKEMGYIQDPNKALHKKVEKDIAVASPIERFFRKLMGEKAIDTKSAEEKIVVEQSTSREVVTLQERFDQGIKDHHQALLYLKETTDPEALFTYLTQAEEGLSQTVALSCEHSFLVAGGDDLEKTLTAFMQNKDALIKEFVNRHYDSCLESADQLKTDEDKRNRYAKDYKELTHYFKQLHPSLVAYINHKWQDKIIRTKHIKEES